MNQVRILLVQRFFTISPSFSLAYEIGRIIILSFEALAPLIVAIGEQADENS